MGDNQEIKCFCQTIVSLGSHPTWRDENGTERQSYTGTCRKCGTVWQLERKQNISEPPPPNAPELAGSGLEN